MQRFLKKGLNRNPCIVICIILSDFCQHTALVVSQFSLSLHTLSLSISRSVRSLQQAAAAGSSQQGAAVVVEVVATVLAVGGAAAGPAVAAAALEHHRLALSGFPLGIMGDRHWLLTSVLMTSLPSWRR